MFESRSYSLAATQPWELDRADWTAIAKRVWDKIGDDDLSARAAAVAFSSMFAIPTLLIAVVSIYGLVASPSQVTDLVDRADSILPDAATELLSGQMQSLTSASGGSLSLGLIIGLAGAIWTVSGAVNRVRQTINEIYGEDDERPWYVKRAWSIVASVGVIIVIVVAVGLIAVLPSLVDWADIGGISRWVLLVGRWLVLGALMIGLLGALYRVGPKRRAPRLWWVSVGAVGAAGVWIVMSYGFGLYVQNFGSYNETYGSLGTVIVFMTWLYLSSFIVLVAGAVNAEMEHQTTHDTTIDGDHPFGSRGAHVADTLPSDTRPSELP